MTFNCLRISAALVATSALLAAPGFAQTRSAAPSSPYGGVTVEDIAARVNDQIISRSDYDRALKELDQEERQRGASMQQMSEAHKDLLRNLIDQQLWLSKAKELGITGETELVNRLNDIRKQYNLATMEDLEKAAREQGVSFEDFKQNIRNQITTQEVMRDQVGRRISVTPGEVERYYEAHKADYAQQESVKLAEILVATPAPAPSATEPGGTQPVDADQLAAAKAKADDIESRLHAGGDFAQLAKSFSDGPTASEGGDLGQFKHGSLAKVIEDQVFALQAGGVTTPIRTKQGFIILKVIAHTQGGIPPFKDVEQDVEQAYFTAKMEPAMRSYLTQMRDEAYIDVRPGYTDTGASPNKRVLPIAYSAYTPPTPKKKKKVERTRFRETTHSFRQKGGAQAAPQLEQTAADVTPAKKPTGKTTAKVSEKPGKKEKIRYGKAPQETLPAAAEGTQTEDAGAVPAQQAASAADEPANPLEPTAPAKKSRFSARARLPKQPKLQGPQPDPLAPAAPESAEVADRQTQAAPLGLAGGATSTKKKKKNSATAGEKTRLSDEKKKKSDEQQQQQQPLEALPAPAVPGAPAPATAPQSQSQPQQ